MHRFRHAEFTHKKHFFIKCNAKTNRVVNSLDYDVILHIGRQCREHETK